MAACCACWGSRAAAPAVPAVQHEMNSSAKSGVGTAVYMAPEVILGESKYDAKVRGWLSHP